MNHSHYFQPWVALTLLCISVTPGYGADANAPEVHIKTNYGEIILKLDAVKAPNTVKNFLQYVQEGFYNNTIFHRVIPGFMIQGGGFTANLELKQSNAPIKNEANNGLKNLRGTIAMARTSDPHSASSQFFINVADNASLDFSAPLGNGWGYAVFGKVTQGMDVVDKIKAVKTGVVKGMEDVPIQTVTMEKVWVKP